MRRMESGQFWPGYPYLHIKTKIILKASLYQLKTLFASIGLLMDATTILDMTTKYASVAFYPTLVKFHLKIS